MNVNQKPSREAFTSAANKLKAAGWVHGATMMIDGAHKEGETKFGTCWHKDGKTFWLNYKTLNNLPA